MIVSGTISITTKGFCDCIDVTERARSFLIQSGIKNGLFTIFCPGSTGGMTTVEYEPGVIRDLQNALEKIVPSDVAYEHNRRWGDGNGFSHVRAALMKPSLTVPVVDGALSLGTWQQIIFIDFDNRKRKRDLVLQVLGEG
jgi:secondary thiamine-phosphate synthase enzyme